MNDSDSGNNWVYSYDGDNNLLSQTDPRGQSTYVSYDVLNRPLCKGTTSASVNPCSSSAYATFFYDSYDTSSNTGVAFPLGCAAPTGSFASDPIGTETADTFRSTAGSGWRCSGYNERGRPDQNSLSVTADGTTTTQTVNASYNDAGQVTTLNYPDGELVTSQYDSNDYLRSAYFGGAGVTDPVTFLVGQVSYTNAGQLAGMAFGGTGFTTSVPTPTFSTSLSYDGIQRPLTSTATRSGTTFWSQTRTYDNVGNVINLNTTVPTTTNGTKTDSQSFCYDDLNRLVWSGNTGTPTGGNHCGLAPNGTTVSAYQQSYSYDDLDRLTNGPSGSETYGTFPTHGAVTLGNVPNQYASYDAMGNMTCRNVDTTSGHGCDAAQSGAIMTYDNEGRLATWVAPNGTVASDQFLYDNSGQRVLQRASNTVGSTTTTSDTISFDGYTDVTITGGTTSTTKYYSAGGQKVAMRQDGTFSYLLPDFLGSTSIALRSDGSVQAVQLFSPFGATRYSDGTMVTPFNFTGQRLDTQTGLLYYNARYYDATSGRFISADDVEANDSGLDPYAYVRGNPELFTDPSGHMLPEGEGRPPAQWEGYSGDAGCLGEPCDNLDLTTLNEQTQSEIEAQQAANDEQQAIVQAEQALPYDPPEGSPEARNSITEHVIAAGLQVLAQRPHLQYYSTSITGTDSQPILQAARNVTDAHNALLDRPDIQRRIANDPDASIPTYGQAIIFGPDGWMLPSNVITGTNENMHAEEQLFYWAKGMLRKFAQSGQSYTVNYIIDQAPCYKCVPKIPGWRKGLSNIKGAHVTSIYWYLSPDGVLRQY
ncbi:hypothetical protein KDK_69740 [Dictyobacter kobayashii]|uniref:Teneurin-like YD-shell domain-containing protein n=2 Tax=Dictyobacter kobayashii TaxID=2014872 RepID=A0A402AVS2_9CHLR|nr:hypothetical protein KDK_69740 [Dictyobacter kobayashii]